MKFKDNIKGKTILAEGNPHAFIDYNQFKCLNNNFKKTIPSNILKYNLTNHYQEILNYINTDLKEKYFTTTDILKHFNLLDISDGTIQRKILLVMVCQGILTKKIKNLDSKETPFNYLFYLNKQIIPCKFLIINEKDTKGICNFEWLDSQETNYFNYNIQGGIDE